MLKSGHLHPQQTARISRVCSSTAAAAAAQEYEALQSKPVAQLSFEDKQRLGDLQKQLDAAQQELQRAQAQAQAAQAEAKEAARRAELVAASRVRVVYRLCSPTTSQAMAAILRRIGKLANACCWAWVTALPDSALLQLVTAFQRYTCFVFVH